MKMPKVPHRGVGPYGPEAKFKSRLGGIHSAFCISR